MSGTRDVSAALRMLAEGIDAGDVIAEFLVIGRTDDGRIISEDSGLSCNEAAYLARDFTVSLATDYCRYYNARTPRADRRRCHGRARR